SSPERRWERAPQPLAPRLSTPTPTAPVCSTWSRLTYSAYSRSHEPAAAISLPVGDKPRLHAHRGDDRNGLPGGWFAGDVHGAGARGQHGEGGSAAPVQDGADRRKA